MRRFLFALTCLLVACGVPLAWEMKDAPRALPDEQYRTGTEVGNDVWIWHCYEQHRIVITQYSSAMCGAKAPRIERGPCGGPLPSELASTMRHGRIPDGMRWPGSPPAPPDPEDLPDAGTVDAAKD